MDSASVWRCKEPLNQIADQYHLGNLHLSMSPVTEMEDPGHRRSASIVSSEVGIIYRRIDEYAYGCWSPAAGCVGSSKIISLR